MSMKIVKSKFGKLAVCSTVTMLASLGINIAHSEEKTLECKLYITQSTDSDTGSTIKTEHAGMLTTVRRGAFCIFPDGQVADKQFTHITHVPGDGSTGKALGMSIYTMDNGDSITTEYKGEWDKSGFKAIYNILGGTGAYKGASGDGTITGLPSPWKTSGTVAIVLNVKTP